MQPEMTPTPDGQRAGTREGGDLRWWALAILVVAGVLMLRDCLASGGARPMWPCDFSCWPAKCQPWCGTPPGVPVREEAPTPASRTTSPADL